MLGFDSETNRSEVLDPALARPGRMSRSECRLTRFRMESASADRVYCMRSTPVKRTQPLCVQWWHHLHRVSTWSMKFPFLLLGKDCSTVTLNDFKEAANVPSMGGPVGGNRNIGS